MLKINFSSSKYVAQCVKWDKGKFLYLLNLQNDALKRRNEIKTQWNPQDIYQLLKASPISFRRVCVASNDKLCTIKVVNGVVSPRVNFLVWWGVHAGRKLPWSLGKLLHIHLKGTRNEKRDKKKILIKNCFLMYFIIFFQSSWLDENISSISK